MAWFRYGSCRQEMEQADAVALGVPQLPSVIADIGARMEALADLDETQVRSMPLRLALRVLELGTAWLTLC
jgi:hypothetical protein